MLFGSVSGCEETGPQDQSKVFVIHLNIILARFGFMLKSKKVSGLRKFLANCDP